MKIRSHAVVGWAALFCLGGVAALSGCSDRLEVAPAEGRVLFRGAPLTQGAVMFQPEQGGQPSEGSIGADGSFRMQTFGHGDGAAVGRNQVRIVSHAGAADDLPVGDGPVADRPLIPPRYANFSTSGLTVEVKSGENNDFTLELTD